MVSSRKLRHAAVLAEPSSLRQAAEALDLTQPALSRSIRSLERALGALCWAACGKDPGFSPISILELLRRRGRVRPEDLARLDLAQEVDLADLKRRWLAALEDVDPLARSRPAEELGCLYYSPARRAFVDPRVVDDTVPHFGRPGGVVPRVSG